MHYKLQNQVLNLKNYFDNWITLLVLKIDQWVFVCLKSLKRKQIAHSFFYQEMILNAPSSRSSSFKINNAQGWLWENVFVLSKYPS